MMRTLHYLSIIAFLLLACSNSDDVKEQSKPEGNKEVEVKNNRPFPQNINFKACIKPNHLSQEQLNKQVEEYYEYWKTKYVKQSNGNTPGGGYYVAMKGTGGDGNEITTSEAHGYGLIAFALMAGYDQEAKKYFDGMYNMYDKHRSTGNKYCMSWIIHHTELTKYDVGSATDGDMDIAYALLLADKQWGSDGDVNYLKVAKDIITHGLKKSDMSLASKRTMLGDWDSDPWTTRSSDWMCGHFRSYYAATEDKFWLDAADAVYGIIESMIKNYTPQTGLMPDFIVDQNPKPAPEYYLDEFKDTDEYNWNACRYPWRITADYLHYNTPKAKEAMVRLLDFMLTKTEGDPANIKAGYLLSGEPMVTFTNAAFVAPIVLASTVDPKYQDYLNKGWDRMQDLRYSYFGDTICLLNMMMISGNWWDPAK